MSTTADTLSRAATLLRERADAATPGPWVTETRPTYDVFDPYRPDAYLVWARGRKAARGDSAETTAYIATMGPALGLLIADWLDAAAEAAEPDAKALTVALAVLDGGS